MAHMKKKALKKRRFKVSKTARVRKWFRRYKSELSCLHCGEHHPACLTFHHKDPKEKDISVSLAVRRGWSYDRIQKEIAKCEVLCLNCHAKLHWDDFKEK